MPLDPRSKRSFRLLAAALVLALFLPVAACSDDEPGPVATSGSIVTFDPGSAVPTVATDPARCTDPLYYVALEVSTTVAEEVPLLRDVAACTDVNFSALWLKNSGEVVWTTTTVRGGEAVRTSNPPMASIFAWQINSDAALLLPGQWMVVDASPSVVEWNYDAAVSVAWSLFDLVSGEVMAKAPGTLNDWLNVKSVRGHAFGTCVAAAATTSYDSWDLISDEQVKASDVLSAVLGATSGSSSCIDELRAVERAKGPGTVTVTADDLTHLISKRSAQLAALDDSVTLAFKMKTLGTQAVKFLIRR